MCYTDTHIWHSSRRCFKHWILWWKNWLFLVNERVFFYFKKKEERTMSGKKVDSTHTKLHYNKMGKMFSFFIFINVVHVVHTANRFSVLFVQRGNKLEFEIKLQFFRLLFFSPTVTLSCLSIITVILFLLHHCC